METKKPYFEDDPDAPPTEEELAASARLRDALEDPGIGDADADLLRALSLAHSPREIDPQENRVLVDRAVVKGGARGRVIRVAFGVSAALALAAGVAATINLRAPAPSNAPVAVAVSRSTQNLFEERFAPTGGKSARIDRIASARSQDLRDNRFAAWGVR